MRRDWREDNPIPIHTSLQVSEPVPLIVHHLPTAVTFVFFSKINSMRLANTWQMTVNEKCFIETALLSNLRIDGRSPYEYRDLTIDFGCKDGSSEVQLGQTRVLGLVTAQLGRPYQDRPNEGSLYIYTEFSPMADPSFEPGRPGELAVELGRIIDRGLRESRAVDTESLCVLPGKLVWSLRVDLQILDNGGNLIDAANIAALAALLTFRRPECTLGGNDGQEVTVHLPEVSEPVPLIVHHLPIAVTFAFFSKINSMVVDPNHFEEALMEGRITFTVNINGDVCAIQKPGGVAVTQSIIIQCLQIAMTKAAEITDIIQNTVELYKSGRALAKLKLNPRDACLDVSLPVSGEVSSFYEDQDSGFDVEKLTLQERCKSSPAEVKMQSPEQEVDRRNCKAKNLIKEPISWDPYPKGVDSELLKVKVSHAAQAQGKFVEKQSETTSSNDPIRFDVKEPLGERNQMPLIAETSKVELSTKTNLSLKDAVKPKNRRKKKTVSSASTN